MLLRLIIYEQTRKDHFISLRKIFISYLRRCSTVNSQEKPKPDRNTTITLQTSIQVCESLQLPKEMLRVRWRSKTPVSSKPAVRNFVPIKDVEALLRMVGCSLEYCKMFIEGVPAATTHRAAPSRPGAVPGTSAGD
ncbi:hypothetical protein EVAR_49094_1 [Eumeta japonica]|uniref:Uncharacterized protein n=1 Tax=Eumeta variegata TaxID=151549 RepID=A0A4C1ZUM1_EUMVA|nr:hypothetical protein EVAR_49094_1 [Eumeta japonica]